MTYSVPGPKAALALNREAAAQLLVAHLPAVARTVRALARRYGLAPDEADEFEGWVTLRLVEDDYQVIRRFRGESLASTYLSAVVATQFRAYGDAERGKWRASAAARREGALVVRLERLVRRDGLSLRAAAERLRTEGITTLSDTELARLLAALPDRPPLRPVSGDPTGLADAAGWDRADASVLQEESERVRAAVQHAIRAVLAQLPDEDQVVLRLRFWHDMRVSDIARVLGREAKPLYRVIERLLARLPEQLATMGVSPEHVARLLEEDDA